MEHGLNSSRQLVILAGVGLMLAFAAPSRAADWRPRGNILLTSDYVLRGVSQNNEQAALQLDVHLRPLDGLTLGAWASQVRLSPRRETAEINLYAQWRWLLPREFSMTAGAVYYAYPDDPRPVPYHYSEWNASLEWRGVVALSAAWMPGLKLFSPTYGASTNRHSWSAELTASHRLPAGLVAQAGIGYFDTIGLAKAGYAYGSASATRRFGHWRTELSVFWVQDRSHRLYASGPAGGPVAASVSWQF